MRVHCCCGGKPAVEVVTELDRHLCKSEELVWQDRRQRYKIVLN